MPTSPLAEISEVLYHPEALQARIRELGREVSRDYKGRTPTLVGVLKGSLIFLADLLRELDVPCSLDFVCLSSYEGENSTGVVRTVVDLGHSPKGKDILVVEDIVDTGLTLDYLLKSLKSRGANSVEVCALLNKQERRKTAVKAKYVGFEIPDKFVVGFGLDYNEKYRNLPYIGILDPTRVPTAP